MEKGKEESGRAFGYPRYAVVRYAQWEPGLYIESIWSLEDPQSLDAGPDAAHT